MSFTYDQYAALASPLILPREALMSTVNVAYAGSWL